MDDLEVRRIDAGNLPKLVNPCLLTGFLQSKVNLEAESAEAAIRGKLAFFHDRRLNGAGARVAVRGDKVVGLIEWYPVEIAPVPLVGEDLHVVNCLQVPERGEREEIEARLVEACVGDWSRRRGVAVLARDKDWGSFGFRPVGEGRWPTGEELTVWLLDLDGAASPTLMPVNLEEDVPPGRAVVHVYETDRCPWSIYLQAMVGEVAEAMSPEVILEVTDMNERKNVLRHGISGGITINGEMQPWYRPHPIPNRRDVRRRIEDYL